MAEPIKSILLVDFDSLYRSLTAGGGEAAARLVAKIPGWLKGLESGRLIPPEERRFTVKVCYADPKSIGDKRQNFTAAGFDVVDCAMTTAGRGIDLMIAMDAVEHLADEERVDEFVLLSVEPTLSPLLARLKKNERRTVIYADSATAQAYRAEADAVLDIAAFAEFLLIHDAPESSSALAVERSEIEAFARKMHAATSIPLFSPRTFAELFRLLTEEIAENGYHFQTTAKNVADRLSDNGRSVTRRQVVFIVKGLALKGHVFSTGDTPRKLAEVFREQARYLIENAGLTLDEPQERILSAWLVDRASNQLPRVINAPAPASAAASAPAAAPAPAPAPATPSTRPAAAAVNGSKPAAEPAAPPAAAKPASPPATKADGLRPMPILKSPGRPAEKPMPAEQAPMAEAREAKTEAVMPSPPPRPEPRAAGSMISPDDARAAIAAKIAQSVRPKPGTPGGLKPAGAAIASRSAAATPPPPPPAPSPPDEAEADDDAGSIENSILAAIAEAVDVLVEDGEPAKPKKAGPQPPPVPATRRRVAPPVARPQIEARPPAAAPEPKPARGKPEPRRDDGDDIGDEIQRIIATYNRNRKDEPEPEPEPDA